MIGAKSFSTIGALQPCMHAYILVAPDAKHIEHYRRQIEDDTARD
jgi:hypothetical protein